MGRPIIWLGSIVIVAAATPAVAQTLSRESDIVDLRLGQKVLVDDGACPAGQIKEISGARLSAAGVVRAARCVPRSGTKK